MERLVLQLVLKKIITMRISFIILGVLLTLAVNAQSKITRSQYIDTYKKMAMDEMVRTGIPASITLAQGILESGNGNSTLATKANNHFGIKCHDWDGPSVRHDDDKKNECFRKYKSADHSYSDHSDFLTGRKRYAELFELKPDDYKGWSKGLKKAGYATSPTYAKALIGIIEDNKLYEYDKLVLAGKHQDINKNISDELVAGREVLYNNRVKYILAKEGDTYSSLTDDLSLFEWQLPRYNECSITDSLSAGDYVYLQPKRKRTYGKHKTHLVAIGDDMHSISQQYGIKEEKLRQRNNIPDGSEPAPGAVLVLKGKLKGNSVPPLIKGEKKDTEEEKIEKDPVEGPDFEIEYDLGS